MILVGVGTECDTAVSASVASIRLVCNDLHELHHKKVIEIEEVQAFLESVKDNRIIFASHGSAIALVDATGARSAYLCAAHSHILAGCYVISYACYTGIYLGKKISEQALLFVGFDTAICAPPSKESIYYLDLTALLKMLIVFCNTLKFNSTESAQLESQNFLDLLFVTASQIEESFDSCAGDGSLLDAEELMFVRQFKDSVCAWVHGRKDILKAERASSLRVAW